MFLSDVRVGGPDQPKGADCASCGVSPSAGGTSPMCSGGADVQYEIAAGREPRGRHRRPRADGAAGAVTSVRRSSDAARADRRGEGRRPARRGRRRRRDVARTERRLRPRRCLLRDLRQRVDHRPYRRSIGALARQPVAQRECRRRGKGRGGHHVRSGQRTLLRAARGRRAWSELLGEVYRARARRHASGSRLPRCGLGDAEQGPRRAELHRAGRRGAPPRPV